MHTTHRPTSRSANWKRSLTRSLAKLLLLAVLAFSAPTLSHAASADVPASAPSGDTTTTTQPGKTSRGGTVELMANWGS